MHFFAASALHCAKNHPQSRPSARPRITAVEIIMFGLRHLALFALSMGTTRASPWPLLGGLGGDTGGADKLGGGGGAFPFVVSLSYLTK